MGEGGFAAPSSSHVGLNDWKRFSLFKYVGPHSKKCTGVFNVLDTSLEIGLH